MKIETDPQCFVREITLTDEENLTAPILRPDGHLAIVMKGRGLVVGPLSPAHLRTFAQLALTIATQLEQESEEAAAAAADQLTAIVAEGTGDA